MYSKTLAPLLVFISISCKSNDSEVKMLSVKHGLIENFEAQNPYPDIAAIPLPEGFSRQQDAESSFSFWLLHTRLKKDKTVYLFDGRKKHNQSAQFAVLDIPVGKKDLQQCADAVMRLRASWLYDQKKYDSIVFYDNKGKAYRFSAPYNNRHFNDYLQKVFGMCGTASLSKQLKKVQVADIEPGHVFIRGGFPGHAVLVVDVIKNKVGSKKFLLAQSYMPAQDIHILLNPAEANGSPWFEVNDDENIITPEYTFYPFELKRW